jgi:hypothetical protein
MNWILNDKPNSVTVNVEDNNDSKEYNFDHVSINCKYSFGTTICFNLSRVFSSYDQRCEFYGSKCEIINRQFKQNAKLSFPQGYAKALEGGKKGFHKCIQKEHSSFSN